nr:hypothetical protein [Chelatococcus sp. HY11]
MATGDGLLVRLRLTAGYLPAATARLIADLAMRHGNGLIDLSSRANLQLRGVTETSLGSLQSELAQAGLLDESPAHEAARNVLASPLSDCDPTALCDARGAARALEAALMAAADPSPQGEGGLAFGKVGWGKRAADVWSPPGACGATLTLRGGIGAPLALPPKFSWIVDDGGALALDDIAADVRFRAVMHEGVVLWAVGLDTLAGIDWIGASPLSALPDIARAIGLAFVEAMARNPGLRRMRQLDAAGRREFVLALVMALAPLQAAPPHPGPLPAGERAGVRGIPTPGMATDPAVLTLALPFGRMAARQLALLAELVEEGCGALRLGPWRQAHLPGIAQGRAAALMASAEAAGFITAAGDARLAIAACPGAPACGSGEMSAQEDAVRIATAAEDLADAGLSLHVSGCAKGCAAQATGRRPPGLTLVGSDGRYELVRGGAAHARPIVALGAAEAAAGLARLAAHCRARGGAAALAALGDRELAGMFVASDG